MFVNTEIIWLTKLKYRILLIVLFICLTILEIKSHSLHWRSFGDAMIYLTGIYDDDLRLKILQDNYLYSSLIVSFFMLISKNKWMFIIAIILMLSHLFYFLPANYISEHDLNIDF